jgi:hypothetical protein
MNYKKLLGDEVQHKDPDLLIDITDDVVDDEPVLEVDPEPVVIETLPSDREKELEAKLAEANTQIENLKSVINKLSTDQSVEMPDVLKNALLTQYDVDDMLLQLRDFEEKYFSDIPMSQMLEPQFAFNVPKTVVDAMRCAKRDDVPDVLNPLLLMYLFFTDDPYLVIGRYLQILGGIMESNMTDINDDAQRYIADLQNGDDGEETDEDE